VDESDRPHAAAERMIGYLSDYDEERFRTIWNHRGFADQRVIAAS
jgi:hypothetical protein